MKLLVEFLGVLRRELGRDNIELSGLSDDLTLNEVLKYLLDNYPKLSIAINKDGTLSTAYMLFINGVDYQILGGYQYRVKDSDKLTFIPIAHGG